MDRQAGCYGSSNMAGLFSECFLVAVAQHAGSSHVIIGGKNGNPWQLMQGLNHVHSAKAEDSAGGSFGCLWWLYTSGFLWFLFLWISLVVHLCALVGKTGAVCGDLSLTEVIKWYRKCCRNSAKPHFFHLSIAWSLVFCCACLKCRRDLSRSCSRSW